jgi:CysZ protein
VYQDASADFDSTNPPKDFLQGFRFFFAGLPLLVKYPRLLTLSLIPIALTIVLLLALAFGSAWLIGQLLATAPAEWRTFFQVIAFLLVLLLSYSLYLPLARVLLAPFSEAISRQTHVLTHGAVTYQPSHGWARAMWEGLKLVALQLVVLLLGFIVSFALPVLGHLLWILLAIATCGLDYLDVPLSARGLPLRAKLKLLWRHKALTFGFGLAGYFLLFIPVINIFSLPVGVIGATLLTDRLHTR